MAEIDHILEEKQALAVAPLPQHKQKIPRYAGYTWIHHLWGIFVAGSNVYISS
jgi:hypothetical protein